MKNVRVDKPRQKLSSTERDKCAEFEVFGCRPKNLNATQRICAGEQKRLKSGDPKKRRNLLLWEDAQQKISELSRSINAG